MLKTLRRLSSICGERNIDHISVFQHLLMFSYLNIKCTIAKGVIMVMERKKRFGKRTCHKSWCLFQCYGTSKMVYLTVKICSASPLKVALYFYAFVLCFTLPAVKLWSKGIKSKTRQENPFVVSKSWKFELWFLMYLFVWWTHSNICCFMLSWFIKNVMRLTGTGTVNHCYLFIVSVWLLFFTEGSDIYQYCSYLHAGEGVD